MVKLRFTHNFSGWSPLHYAVYRGNVKLVNLLAKKHMNIQSKNDQGLTPLDMALERQHVQIVTLLRLMLFDLEETMPKSPASARNSNKSKRGNKQSKDGDGNFIE